MAWYLSYKARGNRALRPNYHGCKRMTKLTSQNNVSYTLQTDSRERSRIPVSFATICRNCCRYEHRETFSDSNIQTPFLPSVISTQCILLSHSPRTECSSATQQIISHTHPYNSIQVDSSRLSHFSSCYPVVCEQLQGTWQCSSAHTLSCV